MGVRDTWRRIRTTRPLLLAVIGGTSFVMAGVAVFGSFKTPVLPQAYNAIAIALALVGFLFGVLALWRSFSSGQDGASVLLVLSYFVLLALGTGYLATLSDPVPFISTFMGVLAGVLASWTLSVLPAAKTLHKSERRERRPTSRPRKRLT